MQAVYIHDIILQNHQYSNHIPKFSLNKRVWPTKLLIINVDAGAKIACRWGMGTDYYNIITSDGLIGFLLLALIRPRSLDNKCHKITDGEMMMW